MSAATAAEEIRSLREIIANLSEGNRCVRSVQRNTEVPHEITSQAEALGDRIDAICAILEKRIDTLLRNLELPEPA